MNRITVIVDNTARRPDLHTEHGFAALIETGTHRVLFDTGQGTALHLNAAVLGIELARTHAIALSHGHYDHTGGLPDVWMTPDKTPLYLHAGALAARYRVSAGTVKEISMPRPVRELVAQHMGSVCFTNQPTEIAPGVWLTGFVPRHHHEEVAEPEPFFLDPCGQQPDHLVDDQALYMVTDSGVIVVLGCAHAGVINTLDHIAMLTGHVPLRAVIGGMHLRAASPTRLAWTVVQLQQRQPVMLTATHCTGQAAMDALAASFGNRYRPAGAGAVFEFADENQNQKEK